MVVGVAMLLALIFAAVTIRKRKFRQHGAWMIRAYALALEAGTQAFTHIPLTIFAPNAINEANRAVAMGAGWLINIIIAEWIIHTKVYKKADRQARRRSYKQARRHKTVH